MGLLIGAGAVYLAAPSFIAPSTSTVTMTGTAAVSTTTATTTATTTVTGTATSGLSGTVTIGVLSDLSDGLSSEGLRVQSYSQQAATDINAWLASTQWAGKVTFKVDVVDYAGSPTTADTELKSLAASGVAAVVGPLSSGVAKGIYKDAQSLQVVLISPSSTSPALAGVSPYLFRTAPNDVYQGKADATLMYSQGVRGAIIVYRDDTYGYGLYNYTSADFSAINASDTVDAVPYSSTATSFTGILPTINTDFTTLAAKYGASHVAIDAISFEEIGYMLKEAQTSYPSLLTTPQPWYGTDGEQGDTALTNSTYGSLMAQIRMAATVFGYTNSSKSLAVCADFATQPSLSCDSYALGAYDDVWLAALSILDCGANSGSCVSSILPSVASSYYGVTGWTLLTSGHDRLGGDYQIWCVQNHPSMGLNWYLCGGWSGATDSVTWVPGMEPAPGMQPST